VADVVFKDGFLLENAHHEQTHRTLPSILSAATSIRESTQIAIGRLTSATVPVVPSEWNFRSGQGEPIRGSFQFDDFNCRAVAEDGTARFL